MQWSSHAFHQDVKGPCSTICQCFYLSTNGMQLFWFNRMKVFGVFTIWQRNMVSDHLLSNIPGVCAKLICHVNLIMLVSLRNSVMHNQPRNLVLAPIVSAYGSHCADSSMDLVSEELLNRDLQNSGKCILISVLPSCMGQNSSVGWSSSVRGRYYKMEALQFQCVAAMCHGSAFLRECEV
jgi:hypothetical protein